MPVLERFVVGVSKQAKRRITKAAKSLGIGAGDYLLLAEASFSGSLWPASFRRSSQPAQGPLVRDSLGAHPFAVPTALDDLLALPELPTLPGSVR
jgi:hypothetical protein